MRHVVIVTLDDAEPGDLEVRINGAGIVKRVLSGGEAEVIVERQPELPENFEFPADFLD